MGPASVGRAGPAAPATGKETKEKGKPKPEKK
jgi:hypothetical protein